MNKTLSGKSAIVTGSTSGIGLGIARAFAGAIRVGRQHMAARRQQLHQAAPLARTAGIGVQAHHAGSGAGFTVVGDQWLHRRAPQGSSRIGCSARHVLMRTTLAACYLAARLPAGSTRRTTTRVVSSSCT